MLYVISQVHLTANVTLLLRNFPNVAGRRLVSSTGQFAVLQSPNEILHAIVPILLHI